MPPLQSGMRFVAVVLDPPEIRRLLSHLRCSRPAPHPPARGPPEHEDSLDFS
jgi:hypothetical protein